MNFSLVCLSLCHWCVLVLCNNYDVLWGDCHSDIDLVIILFSVESYILGIFSLLLFFIISIISYYHLYLCH
jgi:hypothetical protein